MLFHLIAPDYPGYGNSVQPDINYFDYTFDNLAYIIDLFIEVISFKNLVYMYMIMTVTLLDI